MTSTPGKYTLCFRRHCTNIIYLTIRCKTVHRTYDARCTSVGSTYVTSSASFFYLILIFVVLKPLSAIYQLYHSDQLWWWKKPEYPERATGHAQATSKLYHLWLSVECTLFVIYKAGREPTPHW